MTSLIVTSKISDLPDFVPGAVDEALLPIAKDDSTEKISISDLRGVLLIANAFETINAGLAATDIGQVFYVYTDATKTRVYPYKNKDGGSTINFVDEDGNPQVYFTKQGFDSLAKEKAADTVKFRYIVQDSDTRQRSLADAKRDFPSIFDFNAASTTDDSLRLTRAASKGVTSLHIPSDERANAILGRSIMVGDVTFTDAMYLWSTGGEGIDSDVGGIIKKQIGSAAALNWTGTSSSVINGGGLSKIRLFGQQVSGQTFDTGNLVNVKWASHMNFEHAGFNNINGSAMTFQRMQESKVRDCFFRKVGANSAPVVSILPYVGTNQADNVNNFHFEGNTMGYCGGVWFNVSDTSNFDTLWFQFNKLEWDGNVQVVNAASTPVIYLGQVTRAFLNKNFLTNFYSGNNNYGGGLIVVGSPSGGQIQVTNNEFYGCGGAWLDARGARIIAKDNTSNSAALSSNVTLSITSAQACDVEDAIKYTSNFNSASIPVKPPQGFVSAHQMPGAVKNPYVVDVAAGTVYSPSGTVLNTPAATEMKRWTVPWMTSPRGFVKLSARVKCASSTGANGSINLNLYDGTTKTVISSIAITAANGWTWVKWQLKPSQLVGNIAIFTNDGTVPIYFDGAIAADDNFFDWSFTWSPGAIAANTAVSSAIQSPNDIFGVTGARYIHVLPTANDDTLGTILSARYLANGNIVVNAQNPTAAAITPLFTRCNVRIFN